VVQLGKSGSWLHCAYGGVFGVLVLFGDRL
jgi:hypothetical protein